MPGLFVCLGATARGSSALPTRAQRQGVALPTLQRRQASALPASTPSAFIPDLIRDPFSRAAGSQGTHGFGCMDPCFRRDDGVWGGLGSAPRQSTVVPTRADCRALPSRGANSRQGVALPTLQRRQASALPASTPSAVIPDLIRDPCSRAAGSQSTKGFGRMDSRDRGNDDVKWLGERSTATADHTTNAGAQRQRVALPTPNGRHRPPNGQHRQATALPLRPSEPEKSPTRAGGRSGGGWPRRVFAPARCR